MKAIRRGLTTFGRFWWEFLIGDTPELLVAAVVVIGVALALRHDHTAGFIVVPLIVAAALGFSTLRGRGQGPRPPRSGDQRGRNDESSQT